MSWKTCAPFCTPFCTQHIVALIATAAILTGPTVASAARQPLTPPATTPATTPAAPKAPPVATPSLPESEPVPQRAAPNEADTGRRVSDVIEPAAKKILDRAESVAMDLRTIDLVTENRVKTWDDAKPSAGALTEPCRVVLGFSFRDTMSMPKLRMEPTQGGQPYALVVFDGRQGLLLELPTKRYWTSTTDWSALGSAFLGSLPRWIVENRIRGLSREAAASGASARMGDVVAARVLGTEVVDGVECDIVVSAIVTDKINDDPSNKQSLVDGTESVRLLETTAFARTDGLPRRINLVAELPGQGHLGDEDRTTYYRSVKVNAPLVPDTFAIKVPEGFTSGAAAAKATPAASTPPAATTPSSK